MVAKRNPLGTPVAGRTGRPRKDEDRASAREALLDAAHALMCERSTIDVPVSEIAACAGLNIALINYYFGSKDGLLLSLAMRHRSNYASALSRLLEADFTAAKKLVLHIRGLVRAFRRVPYLQRLQHKIIRDSSEAAARQCVAELIQPLGVFYREIVSQGARDGTLKPIDPMHLYITIVGSCDFLYSGSASMFYGFGVSGIDDDASEAHIRHLTSLICDGLFTSPVEIDPG